MAKPTITTTPPDEQASISASVRDQSDRIIKIEKDLTWHQKVGWGAVLFYFFLFAFVMKWWIPHEVGEAKTDAVSGVSSQLIPIQSDISELRQQVATLTALLIFKQTGSFAEAIKKGVDFKHPKVAFPAVRALSEQARKEKVQTSTSALLATRADVLAAIALYPEEQEAGWKAQLALVNYRSSLSSANDATLNPPPLPPMKLGTVRNLTISGGNQPLDHVFWKNVTFRGVRITYDGGLAAFENVTFIDCTFAMAYTPDADAFAGLLLAQNRVTGYLGKESKTDSAS